MKRHNRSSNISSSKSTSGFVLTTKSAAIIIALLVAIIGVVTALIVVKVKEIKEHSSDAIYDIDDDDEDDIDEDFDDDTEESVNDESAAEIDENELDDIVGYFTGYDVERVDFTIPNVVSAYFDYVHLQGKDDAVALVNQQLDAKLANYKDEISYDNLYDTWSATDVETSCSPRDINSVYYDDDGNVSISYSWYWNDGGVGNNGWDNLNVNVYTQQNMTLDYYMGIYDDPKDTNYFSYEVLTFKGSIMEELVQLGLPFNDVSTVIQNKPIREFNYYFDKDNIYICFEPYELNQGGSGVLITIPNYHLKRGADNIRRECTSYWTEKFEIVDGILTIKEKYKVAISYPLAEDCLWLNYFKPSSYDEIKQILDRCYDSFLEYGEDAIESPVTVYIDICDGEVIRVIQVGS